ncbi:MAG: hypothetical protein VX014_03945 [Verrucomicrobiota bacterium]|nr:hypothetical protein [Verrucomicrobiota bacterium]
MAKKVCFEDDGSVNNSNSCYIALLVCFVDFFIWLDQAHLDSSLGDDNRINVPDWVVSRVVILYQK